MNMDVLLSIKPGYVREIIQGNKRYEFRKIIFKEEAQRVFIYSSSPIKKIIGMFYISGIIRDTPENLWAEFRDQAGIDEKEFFNYFAGKDKGYAIEINDLKIFDDPIDPKKHHPNFNPPQSFCYAPDFLTDFN